MSISPVTQILHFGYDSHVGGVNAAPMLAKRATLARLVPVVTEVVNLHLIGDGANEKFIGESMDVNPLSIDSHMGIPVVLNIASPRPASVGLFPRRVFPKSLNGVIPDASRNIGPWFSMSLPANVVHSAPAARQGWLLTSIYRTLTGLGHLSLLCLLSVTQGKGN